MTLDGVEIRYAGLEPILIIAGTLTDVIFNLTAGNDADAVLEPNGTDLKLSGGTFEATTFSEPTGSLTINGGAGNDKLTIRGWSRSARPRSP